MPLSSPSLNFPDPPRPCRCRLRAQATERRKETLSGRETAAVDAGVSRGALGAMEPLTCENGFFVLNDQCKECPTFPTGLVAMAALIVLAGFVLAHFDLPVQTAHCHCTHTG